MSLLLDIHPLGHSLNSAQQIADGCGCDQFNCQRLLPTAPANGFLPTGSCQRTACYTADFMKQKKKLEKKKNQEEKWNRRNVLESAFLGKRSPDKTIGNELAGVNDREGN